MLVILEVKCVPDNELMFFGGNLWIITVGSRNNFQAAEPSSVVTTTFCARLIISILSGY